jgi:hypothetical protein
MRFSHFTCNHSGLGSTGDFSLSGFVVGPTVGVNFQTDAFVFGAEADFDGSWIQGGSSNAFCGTNVGFPGGQCDTKSFFISTGRARFGYAADGCCSTAPAAPLSAMSRLASTIAFSVRPDSAGPRVRE